MTAFNTPACIAAFEPSAGLEGKPPATRLGGLSGRSWEFNEALGDQGELAATGGIVARSSAVTIAVFGRGALIGSDSASTSRLDSDSLLQAYASHGNDLPEVIVGHTAVIVIDLERSKVVAASDRHGVHAVYWCVADGTLLISTSAALLRKPLQAPSRLTSQAIYDYVYFHVLPAPATAFAGMQKLQAGHRLVWQGPDEYSLTRYWQPTFNSRMRERGAKAAPEALKATLRQSVERALKASPAATGAFLSGGLDSSTVAGMLAELRPGNANAFAIGFAAEGYDEMAYARETARHFGLQLHEYYVTPDDIVAALPGVVAAYGEPFGNSSALPAYFCARLARERGMECLLAGDGGDELFSGNERYAHQQLFERYLGLPAWLRSGLVEPLVKLAPGSFPYAGKARSFLAQAHVPLPMRLQHYNFLNQCPAASVFPETILRKVDEASPARLLEGVYRAPDDASTLDRMLFLDWQFTLADNDLRKVGGACELAGIGVQYPMLDEELVAFSLTIPDRQKMKGGNLRHFYKQALRGWLPEATINKSKKGFGLPFGLWLREHSPLRDMATQNLQLLRTRGIFREQFIDETIRRHREGHAAYFGELIWLLLVLELWLQANPTVQLPASEDSARG